MASANTTPNTTLLSWTEGTGVWVLESSAQIYKDMQELRNNDPFIELQRPTEEAWSDVP